MSDLTRRAGQKAAHLIWESYRIWVPLVVTVAVLWWFEVLNIQYEGADWLRTLAKLKHMSLGLVFGHVTWSLAFPYIEMGTLLAENRESFKAVVIARAIYYAVCVLAASMGL